MVPMTQSLTLNQSLIKHAAERGGKTAYTFLNKNLEVVEEKTYQELHQSALVLAAKLRQISKVGDRALLMFTPGLDYISSYFACLYAGVVAVPVYPPQMGRQIDRVIKIIQDATPTAFLCTEDIFMQIQQISAEWVNSSREKWILVDQVDEKEVDTDIISPEDISQDQIAFLQYTSGSTGYPKGVMVSQGNLIENQKMIHAGFSTLEGEIKVVSWLPMYHDMGLIGTVLHPLYLGGSAVLMSPFSFLGRPLNWLEAISQHKGSISGGPNFAFDLCVDKVKEEDFEKLDLSNWKRVFNGAEPIRPETLKRFTETFSRVGFEANSWLPCYGLAEATLISSSAPFSEEPTILHVDKEKMEQNVVQPIEANAPKAQSLVSSGFSVPGQEIVIADPISFENIGEGKVGEVWLRGAHITKGYWNKDEVNQEIFQAKVKGEEEKDFLRTGDLGFLYQNQLYITGRQKDLIIIRGKNHYPQDIELSSEEAHEAIQRGGCAAFSVETQDGESVAIVCELVRNALRKHKAEEIVQAIQQKVAEVHEIPLESIALIPRRTLLKTSSGKVQRYANKKAFLNGKLKTEFVWKAESKSLTEEGGTEIKADNLGEWLVQWLSQKLSIPASKIDMGDPISAYGVDSLMLAEFETEVSEFLGKPWPVRDFLLTEPSLEEIVERGEEFLEE
jgi:acyl-CoA synthetase (AMP-forming)/AMP-acid ligase II/acyl carrier protein